MRVAVTENPEEAIFRDIRMIAQNSGIADSLKRMQFSEEYYHPTREDFCCNGCCMCGTNSVCWPGTCHMDRFDYTGVSLYLTFSSTRARNLMYDYIASYYRKPRASLKRLQLYDDQVLRILNRRPNPAAISWTNSMVNHEKITRFLESYQNGGEQIAPDSPLIGDRGINRYDDTIYDERMITKVCTIM